MWERLLAAMLATYTGKVVTPEVNCRECNHACICQSANKVAHSRFETQRRHHQKSKTGVSVALQMDMCPTKCFLKKVLNIYYGEIKIFNTLFIGLQVPDKNYTEAKICMLP